MNSYKKTILYHFIDDINEGYDNLRNLVLNYLGVANQEQQQSVQEYQTNQNFNIQRQLSTLQSSRPKTDEVNTLNKDFELPRSGQYFKIIKKFFASFSIYYFFKSLKIHFFHQTH